MDSKSAGLSASTISGGQKLVIHQNIPSGAIKRGPHAIVRAAQLNDCIEIQRRCGNFLYKIKKESTLFFSYFQFSVF
uniref:Transformer male-specific splice variant n=1 Tax=Chrysomya megacephala TaxID=115424 RepID=A0A1P8FCM0_CHRMG|nr:transformer male-specific splice variant [Chrysomya megacephala]